MKLFKNLSLVILAVASLTLPASAQKGFDLFSVPRALVLTAPTNIACIAGAGGSVTNGPVDLLEFDGTAVIDIVTATNTVTTGGTLTATLYSSTDRTNTALLGSLAFINSMTSIIRSNSYYTTQIKVTNNYLLPGTVTTPTAGTAGFATRYLNYASVPFTNSGALTVTPPGIFKVGFNADDSPRYLYIVWTPAGSVTNFAVAATVIGHSHDSNTQ